MKRALGLLVVAALLLGGLNVPFSGLSDGEEAQTTPVYQYFDGSYYYYGNYFWKGTWYPSGWYLSPGTPAPPDYVSPSGWPAGGKTLPSVIAPTSQAPSVPAKEGQGSTPVPAYTYYDGRYYFYYRYYWNDQWYPTGWYVSLGVPAPAGYVSPTGWKPGSQVPPYDYYDGSYYYYNPYFWNGILFSAGWYIGLGIVAPIGYISPTGWFFGIAPLLPVPLFFDGFYYYYPRYFFRGLWYGPGWYSRPGFRVPGTYVSPTGWRPGLDPSRFRPVRDMRTQAVSIRNPSRPFRPAPSQRISPSHVPRPTDRRPAPSGGRTGGRSKRHHN